MVFLQIESIYIRPELALLSLTQDAVICQEELTHRTIPKILYPKIAVPKMGNFTQKWYGEKWVKRRKSFSKNDTCYSGIEEGAGIP